MSDDRERLPNCRLNEAFEFEHEGLRYHMSIGRYDDGRPAEIFVSCAKNTSASEFMARDAAVLISIALQYGAPVEVMRGAITRLDDNRPASLTGRVLDEMTRD